MDLTAIYELLAGLAWLDYAMAIVAALGLAVATSLSHRYGFATRDNIDEDSVAKPIESIDIVYDPNYAGLAGNIYTSTSSSTDSDD